MLKYSEILITYLCWNKSWFPIRLLRRNKSIMTHLCEWSLTYLNTLMFLMLFKIVVAPFLHWFRPWRSRFNRLAPAQFLRCNPSEHAPKGQAVQICLERSRDDFICQNRLSWIIWKYSPPSKPSNGPLSRRNNAKSTALSLPAPSGLMRWSKAGWKWCFVHFRGTNARKGVSFDVVLRMMIHTTIGTTIPRHEHQMHWTSCYFWIRSTMSMHWDVAFRPKFVQQRWVIVFVRFGCFCNCHHLLRVGDSRLPVRQVRLALYILLSFTTTTISPSPTNYYKSKAAATGWVHSIIVVFFLIFGQNRGDSLLAPGWWCGRAAVVFMDLFLHAIGRQSPLVRRNSAAALWALSHFLINNWKIKNFTNHARDRPIF